MQNLLGFMLPGIQGSWLWGFSVTFFQGSWNQVRAVIRVRVRISDLQSQRFRTYLPCDVEEAVQIDYIRQGDAIEVAGAFVSNPFLNKLTKMDERMRKRRSAK